mmetsp:Transcript_56691/g.90134  ORF Transcript_56691/g.90134 Transcript_56691/m.90134 type:complete len:181 (+) Transcript_56691:64-606(+)
MQSLCAVSIDGQSVGADLHGVENVAQMRARIAEAIGKPPCQIKLISGVCIVEDTEEISKLESTLTVVVLQREPTWLPVGKYMHDGKEVLKITGSSVYGSRSRIHYVDGSSKDGTSCHSFDDLVKKFGFVTHWQREHDRYYGGDMFEAVPIEDPDEWETFGSPCYAGLSFHESGERRVKVS